MSRPNYVVVIPTAGHTVQKIVQKRAAKAMHLVNL